MQFKVGQRVETIFQGHKATGTITFLSDFNSFCVVNLDDKYTKNIQGNDVIRDRNKLIPIEKEKLRRHYVI